MQISVSSTLTVYHDGQFWVGLAEHVEDGRYGVARIVFGAEPSDEGNPAFHYKQMGEARVLRRRSDRGEQAREEPQETRPRGVEGP